MNALFGQQMGQTDVGFNRAGGLGQAIAAAEAMDLQRRQGEFGRNQAQYRDDLSRLLAGENIAGTRLAQAQSPLSLLLSTLSGTNVAPGAIPGLQMPQQGPSTGQQLGGFEGSLISNIAPELPWTKWLG